MLQASHRYGNSRAIWDHTVLPATRQRWHSRLYPSQLRLVLDLATPEGCKAELIRNCVDNLNKFSRARCLSTCSSNLSKHCRELEALTQTRKIIGWGYLFLNYQPIPYWRDAIPFIAALPQCHRMMESTIPPTNDRLLRSNTVWWIH